MAQTQCSSIATWSNIELLMALPISARRTGGPFMSMPTELQLSVSSHLPYPDALSLKHSCRHFYNIVDTGIRLKVEWLIERVSLHLECPKEGQCILRTDAQFCSTVRPLIEKRRRHEECGGHRGCLVRGGTCRKLSGSWPKSWVLVSRCCTVEMLALLIGLVVTVLATHFAASHEHT